MIDSLVKVAEKIVELGKYREERRLKQFKAVVEPTYAGLKRVHANYLEFLEATLQDLAEGKPYGEVLKTLEQKRLKEEAERRALIRAADLFANDDQFKQFQRLFFAIEGYFHSVTWADDDGLLPKAGPQLYEAVLNGEKDVQWLTVVSASTNLVNFLKTAVDCEPRIQIGATDADHRRVVLEFACAILGQLRYKWDSVSEEYYRCVAASHS